MVGDEDVTQGSTEKRDEFDPRIETLVQTLMKDALAMGDLKQGRLRVELCWKCIDLSIRTWGGSRGSEARLG